MSVIFAMGLFSLSMSISPGPVNLITLAAGVNYGFKNAMPFVSGATIGFSLLLLLVGISLGSLTSNNTEFLHWLGIGGAAFMGYMGYKIALSKPEIEVKQGNLPAFHQGFLLQWLNPKAWIACVSGVTAFNLSDSTSMLAIFVCLYFVICYVSIASWAMAGDKIKIFLTKPKNLRIFNGLMGGLLILVAIYLLCLQIFTISM